MAKTVIALLACLTGAAMLAGGGAEADEGSSVVEKVEYKGWQNNVRLANGDAELIVTLDVGPRIICYRLKDGRNVFKEYDEQLGKAGENDWQIRGGHRLWAGPEDLTRTYAPDNRLVKYEKLGGEGPAVRVTPPEETQYGIQKAMDIRLAPHGSQVTVVHRITNTGTSPTSLAPWALSVMAPGGVEIIPLPPHKPHPGPPKNARSPKDYAPNLFISFWPFFDFADRRWQFGTKYITLRQDPDKGPTKIGLAHQMGWVGYLNNGTLFTKKFGLEEGKHYPDHGCNFETFTNQEMLEVESLGPINSLESGKAVEHTETWELSTNLDRLRDEPELVRLVTAGR
jgi:hypothetical protein